MSRIVRRIGDWPRTVAAIIVLLGLMTVAAVAQTIKLSDGTFGQKVVLYNLAGVEQNLISALTATLDVNIKNVNGSPALDAFTSGTLQNAAGADGNGSTLTTNGYIGARFDVTITNTATVNFECSSDGSTYVALWAQREGATPTLATATTVTGSQWRANIAACQAIRARISGWASGTVTVTARGVFGPTVILPQLLDPCQTETKTTTSFSQTSIANIITAVSGKTNYVCAMSLVAAAAEVVSVVEDDTTACASPTVALTGSLTAANGQSLAANGGYVLGDGTATVLAGSTSNRYLCVLQNGSNRVSGFITWVQR